MVFHIQGVLGLVLYFNSSPLTRLFFQKPALATEHWNVFFFGIWHITCMLLALVAASVGASTVKRVPEASRKFYLTFIYTLITLLLVFLGMPWDRPAFRSF
jgi:phage-related holin